MNKKKQIDENIDKENDAKEIEIKTYKKHIYSKIERILSEDDLKNPAIIKLILDDNELLKDQIDSLKYYVDNYHEVDKELSIYKERNNKNISHEILHDVCITIGGLLAGFIAIDFTKPITTKNIFFLGIGLVLILGSSISKWRKK